MRRCLLTILSIAFANAAYAHPGHGTGESASGTTWWHFLSEPVHMLPLLAVVVLAITGIKLAKHYGAFESKSHVG